MVFVTDISHTFRISCLLWAMMPDPPPRALYARTRLWHASRCPISRYIGSHLHHTCQSFHPWFIPELLTSSKLCIHLCCLPNARTTPIDRAPPSTSKWNALPRSIIAARASPWHGSMNKCGVTRCWCKCDGCRFLGESDRAALSLSVSQSNTKWRGTRGIGLQKPCAPLEQ